MQMCQSHWEQLKKALRSYGLEHLFAKDGKELAKRLEGTQQGKIADHEPLISAHTAIVSNALAAGGKYLMGKDENGNEYCPLCEAKKHLQKQGPNMDEVWMEYAAKEQFDFCLKNNLIKQD